MMMEHYISKRLLKSGEIKEYDFLNEHYCDKEEGVFSVSNINADIAKRIGIKQSSYGVNQLSAKVGAIWLDNAQQVPMVVRPKVAKLDAVKMYLELTEHTDLFTQYHSVFQCWPEEKAIAGVAQPDVTLLQVAVFLKELSRFCQRDLRQGFVRVRQNLTGKVKGKILIAENLRRNTLNTREDRVFCQYHIMSLDTPANRILKTALTCCYRYLGKQGKCYPGLLLWARQCNVALSTVPESSRVEADFRGIVYSGLMRKYQRPHQYARMILKRLRTDATGSDENNWTVPYVLDMNRLFEGYVGVLLSRIQKVNFVAQNSHCVTGNKLGINFSPDYHDPQRGIVVDAKYKSIVSYQEDSSSEAKEDSIDCDKIGLIVKNAKPNNADIYQVIAYCKLLEEKHPGIRYKTAALAVPVTHDKSWNGGRKWCKELPRLKLKRGGITLYILPCPVPVKVE